MYVFKTAAKVLIFSDIAKYIHLFANKFGCFIIMYYLCIRKTRRVGRVIDRAGLEIRYTLFGYRGFESLTLRHNKERMCSAHPLLLFSSNKRLTRCSCGLSRW